MSEEERKAEDAELEADRQKRQAIIGGVAEGAMGALGLGAASGFFGDKAKTAIENYQEYTLGDTVNLGGEEEKNAEHGRKYQFRDGGDVMMLDGEFSHETNKKAIIDEETGIKEGEMTGQEALVFNDEHVAIIEELTNRGDDEMLMKFMRQLLSQPQFQDEA